jgi:energy-coupling factor transporter ATP-binding protein EcfA2
VLEGVDLELRAGAVTCLRGANGSGKSTLLRCLAGLHAPEAGRVWLAGREVGDLPPEERFPAMGFVGQNPWRHLLAERVDAEVQLGPAHAGVTRPERRRRATALLERLELGGLGARHPHDLSSGQRQRVAVAAALASEPRVLMLDEPTRGADPVSRRAIIQVLRDHTERGGAALVATHDTAFAHEVSDVHLALREGVVVPTVEAGGLSA